MRRRVRQNIRIIGTALLAGIITALWGVVGSNALALSPFIVGGVAGTIAALVVGILTARDIRRANAAAPVVLQQLTVSRKTMRDGKIEVSEETGAQLDRLGLKFDVVSLGEEGRAERESMLCRCEKANGERHMHLFIVSPLFQKLAPNTGVNVVLDTAADKLRIEPAESHVQT